ncbi:MAG: response regulator [Cyanobacteriota bacterium]|nr:response regulator [Cyanobacteriota bacterium]
MTTQLKVTPKLNSLAHKLVVRSQHKFTGRLEVRSDKGRRWDLYFCVGRLAWAIDAVHSVRQLRRHLEKNCPTITFERLTIRDSDRIQCWCYHVLWVLEKRALIDKDASSNITHEMIQEVLFDLLQEEDRGELTYTDREQNVLQMLKMPPTAIDLKSIYKQSQQAWKTWKQEGLAHLSPNLAPVLVDRQALQKRVSSRIYQNLSQRLNGTYTLRELALMTKQSPNRVLQSLMPYLQKKWLELADVPDIPRPAIPTPQQPTTESKIQPSSDRRPLIACVDDSPQNCRRIEQILTQAGYRAIALTDSVQAIPILLEKKPDLLFLDLVMPVANGYEVCTQLRRITDFDKMPIVILTNNDGMLDRMRAKVVKASAFLSKPIEPKKILRAVKKYVSVREEQS